MQEDSPLPFSTRRRFQIPHDATGMELATWRPAEANHRRTTHRRRAACRRTRRERVSDASHPFESSPRTGIHTDDGSSFGRGTTGHGAACFRHDERPFDVSDGGHERLDVPPRCRSKARFCRPTNGTSCGAGRLRMRHEVHEAERAPPPTRAHRSSRCRDDGRCHLRSPSANPSMRAKGHGARAGPVHNPPPDRRAEETPECLPAFRTPEAARPTSISRTASGRTDRSATRAHRNPSSSAPSGPCL